MDPVIRYVNAVRVLLPRDQRDDIAAELTEAVRARMDERQAELGRKLSRADQDAILREFGHPIFAASRYGPQKSLIGPAVYPVYVLALRWSLVVVSIAQVAVFAIRAVSDQARIDLAFDGLWNGLVSMALGLFAVITLVFAYIERSGPEMTYFGDWKAGDLPALRRRKGPLSRAVEAAFGLGFSALMLSWFVVLALAPESLPTVSRPGFWLSALGVQASPIWFPAIWSFALASTLLLGAGYLTGLVSPANARAAGWLRVASDVVAIAMAAVALASGPLLVSDGLSGAMVGHLNLSLRVAFGLGGAISAIDGAWAAWSAMRPRSDPAAPAA